MEYQRIKEQAFFTAARSIAGTCSGIRITAANVATSASSASNAAGEDALMSCPTLITVVSVADSADMVKDASMATAGTLGSSPSQAYACRMENMAGEKYGTDYFCGMINIIYQINETALNVRMVNDQFTLNLQLGSFCRGGFDGF